MAAETGEAVHSKSGFAIVDRLAVPSRTATNIVVGGPEFRVEGVYLDDETMKLVVLEVRSLGFQRKMVSWVFLIESSFVALLGICLGVGLALIPASQLVADMAVDIPGLTFQVPWTEIIVVFVLTYGMTLLTTWLPAVQASRIKPAEALRYE